MPSRLAISVVVLVWFLPLASASGLDLPVAELSTSPAERALAVSGSTPHLATIAPMQVQPGGTADQDIEATDSDGQALSFSKGGGPDYMSVMNLDAGAGTAKGTIHLAPPEDAVIGHIAASVIASDGTLEDERTFTIYASNNPPALEQPEDMTVEPFHQVDQALRATDPDQDPLTFSLTQGPSFAFVKTTGPGTGNVRLTPVKADSGTYQVSVSVSDGFASHARTFSVTVLPGTIPTMGTLSDMTVSPGQFLSQPLYGRDVDWDVLRFSKVSGPSFMTVSGLGSGQVVGSVTLSPTFADDPTIDGGDFDYPATVSLSDGRFSTSQSFSIHVHFPGSHPPVLVQPADIHVPEGYFASTSLSYTDPDSEPLTVSLSQGPHFLLLDMYPPTVWADPGFDDAGAYNATVRVTDSRGLYDEKTFQVIVTQAPRPPRLQVPMDMLVFAGRTSEQDLHATDPEGYPLHFWSLFGLAPDYVSVETIDPGTGSALGRFRVFPTELDIGRRDVVNVLVSNSANSDEGYVLVEVADPARFALMHTYNPCVSTRDSTIVWFLAADPDGRPVAFELSGLLPWMTFVDHGNGTASLVLRPTAGDTGGNFMTIKATNGVTVLSEAFAVNLGSCGGFAGEGPAPIAVPGGPYAGFVGTPVAFNGSESTDPDGHALTQAWNFGDGSVALATNPEHTYSHAGQFQVDLIVTDGIWSGRSSTTVSIADALAARVVATAHSTVRLNAGSAPLQIWLEAGEDFQLDDVDPGALSLEYDGGAPHPIHGEAMSSPMVDHDGNGSPEIAVSFRKEDLRALFSSISGRTEVNATLKGKTLAGTPFRAVFPLTVIPGRGKVRAALYPNPLNPGGTLSFTTQAPGSVHVSIFDLQGRLVRTLLDTDSAPAGYHEVQIEGRTGTGARFASGVYFYRIETPGDVTTGRFAVLK